MDPFILYVLLLSLLCFDSEGTIVDLVKTIGSGPDVTPICKDSTLDVITLVVCKIRTERRAECHLLYQYGQDFEHQCDSRFKFMTQNQTLFLHLSSLTPEDSGNYTCECSHLGGTSIFHLNITVEDYDDAFVVRGVLTGACVVIIAGVILGLFHWMKTKGYCSRSTTSGISVGETPGSPDKDDPDGYTSLQRPASDVYHDVTESSKTVTVHLDNQEARAEEAGRSCGMYENIQTKESR